MNPAWSASRYRDELRVRVWEPGAPSPARPRATWLTVRIDSIQIEPDSASASVIDVLDHVLDKGIVIDAWMRVSLAGIDLVGVEARIVVASISTYVAQAHGLAELAPVAAPPVVPQARHRSIVEQLWRVRQSLEAGWALPAVERHRAEDRILDDLRDAHTRIVSGSGRDARRRQVRDPA